MKYDRARTGTEFDCCSCLCFLVFNNESKFYSYSFVLVPELLKEHSPLSTSFEMLFAAWRMNLETHSKDLSSKISLKLETSIKTCTSVSHRFYTEFSLLLRRMGENSSCLENCTSKQRSMGTNIISTR